MKSNFRRIKNVRSVSNDVRLSSFERFGSIQLNGIKYVKRFDRKFVHKLKANNTSGWICVRRAISENYYLCAFQ